jgi:hypothetical protein
MDRAGWLILSHTWVSGSDLRREIDCTYLFHGCPGIETVDVLTIRTSLHIKLDTLWILLMKHLVLSGSTVTTACHVLGLRIEETASRYGGYLRICWISCRGLPTVGGPPAWGLGGGLTTLPRKTQYLLRITTHSLGTGRITWRNLSTGKWTWDLVHGMLGANILVGQVVQSCVLGYTAV